MTTQRSQEDIVREVLARPAQAKRRLDERLRAFSHLPFLTDGLRKSHIQLVPEDPQPPPVDGKLIRKAKPGNVMLSEPYREGHVVYFNIFQETDEINIDHPSDHFVGLPILEAVRQVGMAISHAVGDIPLDTRMSLQDFSLSFTQYIEHEYPIVVRGVTTLSYDRDLSGDVTVFSDVRQNGETCLAATSSGRLYDTEKGYKKTRGKTLDLHRRQAEHFAAQVGRGTSG
ncbi:MAG: AfsA-related hotdog domain-containing protein [Egibacteraceae bacterium]